MGKSLNENKLRLSLKLLALKIVDFENKKKYFIYEN